MTGAQMIDAVEKHRQADPDRRPAAVRRGQRRSCIDSLGEDPFGGGLFRRLSGKPPKGGNARARIALDARRLGAAVRAAKQAIALDQVAVLLQRKAGALNRIRRHVRIRALLEVWLYVHVPLTFALIAALAAHIVSVFFYW